MVLLVLIGLAGLTLPYVSGFISKTHNSTSADAGANLFTALQRYQTEDYGIPNNLNALVDTTGATLPSYLDNSFNGKQAVTASLGVTAAAAVPAATGVAYAGTPQNFTLLSAPNSALALASLAAANLNTLAELQIGTVTPNADGTFSAGGAIAASGATFTPEVLPTSVGYTTPTQLVTDMTGGIAYANTGVPTTSTAPGTSIALALGYTVPTNHGLIVLGIGSGNAAVGKTIASVPVHFGDKASLQPTFTYSRFLAAVDVDLSGNNAPAKVVGIVHAPDVGDKWESLYSSIASYYTPGI